MGRLTAQFPRTADSVTAKPLVRVVVAVENAQCIECLSLWFSGQNIDRFHLTLVHVAGLSDVLLPESAMKATFIAARQDAKDAQTIAEMELLKQQLIGRFPESTIECQIARGEIISTLVQLVAERQADMVVIFRTGSKTFMNLFRSLKASLSRKIPYPIEIVCSH